MTFDAPNTSSTIQYDGGANKTSTSLATNIIIMVGTTAVGAVQTLQLTETRAIKMIDEVGTDGHIDSAPQNSTKIVGNCTRVRFDRLRVAEAFSRSFIHVASQIYPFDIIIYDRQKLSEDLQIATVVKNVWINSIQYTYQVNDWIISDTMGFEAETIYSVLNGGTGLYTGSADRSVAVGGERNILNMGKQGFGPGLDERTVDTGGRRGSMDISGIIDIGSAGPVY